MKRLASRIAFGAFTGFACLLLVAVSSKLLLVSSPWGMAARPMVDRILGPDYVIASSPDCRQPVKAQVIIDSKGNTVVWVPMWGDGAAVYYECYGSDNERWGHRFLRWLLQ